MIVGARTPAALALAAALTTTASAPANAAQADDSARTDTEMAPGERADSASAATDAERAERWGLTEQDWARYERLMDGPRGIWTPDLDPLTVLGVNARSDAERRRYAEALMRLERERVEGELAFEKAVQRAKKRLYPNLELYDRAALKRHLAEKNRGAGAQLAPGDRALAFVNVDCPPCNAVIDRLVDQVQAKPGLTLDVYVVGGVSDTAIRRWASRQAIPRSLVDSQRVTLNHDRGTLARLTQDPAATVPVALRSRGGQLSALGVGAL